MVYVLTVFLKNIKLQYHGVVVRGSIFNTGISVEQDWNG